MHGRNLVRFGLVALAVIVMLAARTALADPIKLTYSVFWPAGHPHTVNAEAWADEIFKRTNGAVKITVFPGGTLTGPDKCYDGVLTGISALCGTAMSYTRGRFPLSEVLDLPLGSKDGLEATLLANAFLQKFHPRELDDVKVMYLHGHGPGILHTRGPVQRLEDLKGLKIRSTGLSSKVVAQLGATPVGMPMTDTYDALRKGVVDGSVAPIAALEGFKWGEVVKYSIGNFGSSSSSAFIVAMGKSKWNSLPPDVQRIIEQVNAEWVGRTGQVWNDYDRSGREFATKLGNTFVTLSSEEDARWADAVRPTLEDYVEAMQKRGLPGKEALAFCLDWLKQHHHD